MKKISFFISAIILSGILFTSCVKDRNVGPDFSSTDPVLELRTPIADIAGLAYFGRAVIGNLPDVQQFYVNLASANTLDHDINVTIGVDPSLIDTYNADDNNAVKYELLPDSDYTISKTALTIVKGQRIDSVQITFFKDKIDPTHNYMLPVTITDGDGILISGNQGTIWFHAIGNPVAGAYNWEWIRWNASDTTGVPDYDLDYSPAAFSPRDPTTIETPSGYYYQARYIIAFDNNNGVLSNFRVSFDQDDIDTYYTPNGVSMSDPVFIIADPISGQFRIYSVATTSSGPRNLIDFYYK
jgi:hypothetical protein